jgi:hypothetical protein
MALVNALFPPVVHLEDSEDFDPSPYWAGLRESIRFSLYELLMGSDPFSETKKETIRIKLLCWCNIPDYETSRQALVRYAEETKKLEQVCLEVLDSMERCPRAFSEILSAETSLNYASDGSFSPDPGLQGHRRLTDMSYDSRDSGWSRHRLSSVLPDPHALLGGMPGREIMGSRTDLGAFVGEPSEPQSSLDLSTTEFDEHPLARDLDMSSADKATLGLLIPKALSTSSL